MELGLFDFERSSNEGEVIGRVWLGGLVERVRRVMRRLIEWLLAGKVDASKKDRTTMSIPAD